MQNIRLHLSDLSDVDMRISDLEAEELNRWLRFANQNDMLRKPWLKEPIKRKDIVRTTRLPDDLDIRILAEQKPK